MTGTKAQSIRALQGAVRDAAAALDEAAVATLAAHPHALRAALAAAASALARPPPRETREIETLGGAEPARIDSGEAERRLAARTRPVAAEGLLSSDEIAARMGLRSRQSVHDWRRKGQLIGWRSAKRGYVFPEGQLDARGRPVEGLERIAPFFPDAWAAWVWLTTPQAALDGETPLALLGRGDAARVTAAAEGYAQGDFA